MSVIKKGQYLFDDTYCVREKVSGNYVSAEVWKIHHEHWNKDMCLKIPKDEYLKYYNGFENFKREYESWTNLGLHPNIVQCYYVREIDGKPAIFSEWMGGNGTEADGNKWSGGGNLTDAIKSEWLYRGTAEEQQRRVVDIAFQIMLGLRYAHLQTPPVIHKDIKPDNIMVSESSGSRIPSVKITDFGISNSVSQSEGTPGYRSPEQLEGKPLDKKTDYFSWALTVMEMCIGMKPWGRGEETRNKNNFAACLEKFKVKLPEKTVKILCRCLGIEQESNASWGDIADDFIDTVLKENYGTTEDLEILRNFTPEKENADSLNNRAISYIDLKENDKAAKCWEQALKISPRHLESVINYNIYKWKYGEIDDVDLIKHISRYESYKSDEVIDIVKSLKQGSYSEYVFDKYMDDDMDYGRSVRYSKDGSKIMVNYDLERRTKIFSTQTQECIDSYEGNECDHEIWDNRIYGNTRKKLEFVWSLKNCPAIRDTETRQILCTYLNYRDWLAFSPDGKKVLFLSSGTLVEEDVPEKPELPIYLSDIFSVEEIIKNRRNFDVLKNAWEKESDIQRQIDILNKIKKIPHYGESEEFYKCKRTTAKHCEKKDFVLLKEERYFANASGEWCGDLFEAEGSADMKYLLLRFSRNGYYHVYELWDIETRQYIKDLAPQDDEDVIFFAFFSADSKRIYFSCESKSDYNYEGLLEYEEEQDDDFSPVVKKFIYDIEEGTYTPCSDFPEEWHRCVFPPKLPVPNCLWISPDRNLLVECGDNEGEIGFYISSLDYTLVYNKKETSKVRIDENLEKRHVINDKNRFLFEMMDARTISCFALLAEATLENPGIKFKNDATKALEHCNKCKNQFGEHMKNYPPHEEDSVQKMIEVSDEEYDKMFNDCKEHSKLWGNKNEHDVLSLFIEALKEPSPLEEIGEKYADIPVFTREKATDRRRREYLPELVRQNREMRETLLNTVLGQDHAVQAFVEGLFNAQVLAEADKNRKKPLAIFTFAGPPGVGKTFLAEQTAVLMGMPCERFDMSEYARHESHQGLIGWDPSYKSADAGRLTKYVKENPKSILIFDEIEKAHSDVLQIFYQLLDNGFVEDKFLSEKIPFKDTIVIFTSNAGRALYEGDCENNATGVTRKTLLNALETEINPMTREPFFPAALVSRIATGYPVIFNHLQPHHLAKIIENEFCRCKEMVEKLYEIKMEADKEVMLSLLFSQGGKVDARTLRAQTELFFKDELHKIYNSGDERLSECQSIHYRAETQNLPESIEKLFFGNDSPGILLYANDFFSKRCKERLPGYTFYTTRNIDEASKIISENDIRIALIDIAEPSTDKDGDAYNEDESLGKTSIISSAAKRWRDGKRLFNTLRKDTPELPIYLVETVTKLNNELVADFLRAGARGKLVEPDLREFEKFNLKISEICRELYMQGVASEIAAEHKVLYFNTAPQISENDVLVCLRNFELKRAADADDADDLLSDAEKPKERFEDVIGAETAKDELKYFADYLKNPKRYMAMGQRAPKGILLYGKPGTGKTMLAKAMAGECDVTYIPAVASTFVNKYVGSGSAAVRELFNKARRYAPAIIFIDEVDTIAKQRNGLPASRDEENTLNALLAEMDGFAVDPKRPVFVLAATNYGIEPGQGVGVLDEAFMRRFDRKILVELPNKDERRKLLELMLSKVKGNTVSDEMTESIASRSIGVSPSVLTNILETAKREAFKQNTVLDDAILNEAYESMTLGEKKQWSREYLERTARHEAGHTFIYYIGGHTPEYLTVESRGNIGGYMHRSEEELESPLRKKADILDEIRCSLGGRAAEIVYYGEEAGISTGASSDLRHATYTAENMIISYGMDEEFGLAVMDSDAATSSEKLRERVNEVLDDEMKKAVEIIHDNKQWVDVLVDALLEKNRLKSNEIEDLLGKNLCPANKDS